MLDFQSGILKFKRSDDGLKSLVGWTIHAPRSHVGTIVEVILPRKNTMQTLLRTEKITELTSSYRGVESHILPLVDAYVQLFDEEREQVLTRLPSGFLELGRRKLILSYLEEQLRPLSIEGEVLTRGMLEERGRSDLLRLMSKAGGASSVASELGLKWKGKKRNGYWDDLENLDLEIEMLINDSWIDMGGYFYNSVHKQVSKKKVAERGSKRFMPSTNGLISAGRWDLYNQIMLRGGLGAVGEMLGRKMLTRKGRQAVVSTKDELIQEIKDFMASEGEGGVIRLPTESELHRAGRSEIVYGTHRLLGGFTRLSIELGTQMTRRPRSHWREIDNVVREVNAFVTDRDERLVSTDVKGEARDIGISLAPKLPTQMELRAAGRNDLIYAMRLHGHSKIARLCNLREESRGVKKGILSMPLVEALFESSSPLGLVQLQERLAVEQGATVTKQALSQFLNQKAKEGLIVKVSRGVWSLGPRAHEASTDAPKG